MPSPLRDLSPNGPHAARERKCPRLLRAASRGSFRAAAPCGSIAYTCRLMSCSSSRRPFPVSSVDPASMVSPKHVGISSASMRCRTLHVTGGGVCVGAARGPKAGGTGTLTSVSDCCEVLEPASKAGGSPCEDLDHRDPLLTHFLFPLSPKPLEEVLRDAAEEVVKNEEKLLLPRFPIISSDSPSAASGSLTFSHPTPDLRQRYDPCRELFRLNWLLLDVKDGPLDIPLMPSIGVSATAAEAAIASDLASVSIAWYPPRTQGRPTPSFRAGAVPANASRFPRRALTSRGVHMCTACPCRAHLDRQTLAPVVVCIKESFSTGLLPPLRQR